MGTSVSSVHVFCGTEPVIDVLTRVLSATRSSLTDDGFVEVTDERERPGPERRNLLVGRGEGERWLSIFDEDDATDPERLAAVLSERARTSAVSLQVNDSDVVVLNLFVEGRRIDTLVVSAGSDGTGGLRMGSPELWNAVLTPGMRPADLERACQRQELFAEDLLPDIAEVLGLDVDVLAADFRSVDSGMVPLANKVSLRFRARPDRPARALGNGLPVLVPVRGVPEEPWILKEGTSLLLHERRPFELRVLARNVGGPGRGVRVSVQGPAIEARAIEITGFSIQIGEGPIIEGKPVELATDVGSIFHAAFDNLALPGEPAGSRQESPGSWIRAFVRGKAGKAGRTRAVVVISPFQNAMGGSSVHDGALELLHVN